jgi:hypothetical protein
LHYNLLYELDLDFDILCRDFLDFVTGLDDQYANGN